MYVRVGGCVPVRIVVAEEVEADEDANQEQDDHAPHYHTHYQQQ